MKKVTGQVSCRPLGCYDYEFFVDDDTTDEEIKEKIDSMLEIYSSFEVEYGYEACTEIVYRKV